MSQRRPDYDAYRALEQRKERPMSDLRFAHTDRDGDRLEVRGGELGAVIGCQSDEEAEVAVRYEYLPGLIATLQDILAESDYGLTK